MNERDRGFVGSAAGTVLAMFLVIGILGFFSHLLGWPVDKQKAASLPQTTPVVSVVTNMKPVDSGESAATNVPSGEGARVATMDVRLNPVSK